LPEQHLDWLIEQYPEQIALIRYHVWWPTAQDPFYLFNVPENTARNNYYSNFVAPHLFIDGADAGFDFQPWEALFIARSQVQSDWEISIDGSFNISSRNTNLNLDIFLMNNNPAGTENLRIALVENNIYYDTPYTDIHQQTFRDMVPSVTGDIIDIDDYGIYEASYTFHVDENINTDNCEIVIFIQTSDQDEILQGFKIPFTDLNVTSVDDTVNNPEDYYLLSNYPDPFNSATTIRYSIPENNIASNSGIEIYNLMGQRVETIEIPQWKSAGSVLWDAGEFSSGLYFAVLKSGDSRYSTALHLVK
jgi:hypothetical protein